MLDQADRDLQSVDDTASALWIVFSEITKDRFKIALCPARKPNLHET